MICFNNVCFSYDKTSILHQISCEIKRGELIGIVGPNGGGKTTFLKLAMGLLAPVHGTVLIDEKPPAFSRTTLGYVPQLANFDRDFPITTFDLVLMGCIRHLNRFGFYSEKAKSLANEALQLVGLEEMALKPFGNLSGGQARRALIARGIVDHPDILILDEPTANVDHHAEESINTILSQFKGKMTILVVTHELPGIIPLADRVFCIQRSLSISSPQEVCQHTAMGIYHPNFVDQSRGCCD